MGVVSIIQARTGSTRLPRKVLKPILGKPMLSHMLERVKRAKKLDAVVVATTNKSEDDSIVEIAVNSGVGIFRGDEKDVLGRFYKAAKQAQATTVVRLTGDCPLMDPVVIDQVVTRFQEAQDLTAYLSTPSNYPEGLDVEVFDFSVLEVAARQAGLPSEREHVSLYIKNHPESFKVEPWQSGEINNSFMHWSVDTEADFVFVTKIFEQLYPTNPDFNKDDIIELLVRYPEFLEINKGATGYEGLAKSLQQDDEFKKHQTL